MKNDPCSHNVISPIISQYELEYRRTTDSSAVTLSNLAGAERFCFSQKKNLPPSILWKPSTMEFDYESMLTVPNLLIMFGLVAVALLLGISGKPEPPIAQEDDARKSE